MNLNQILAQATIKELENLDLVGLVFYSINNHQVLALLHDNGILDNPSIERVLKNIVITQAKKDYSYVVTKRNHPDHVAMPECLAYAIQHKIFSPEEITRIPFDHAETPEIFCQTYGKENLLTSLRENLLNPKPLPDLGGADCC